MSTKLDQELADAILPKDTDAREPVAARPARIEPRSSKRSVGLLVTLVALVGAVVALFLVGFKDAAVYAITVDKLVKDKGSLTGRKVRVEGELVPGTLVKRDAPCEYRFAVHKDKDELPVRYGQCVIPDTFRDVPGGGVQVTIEGTLTSDGHFEATQVMAKCASKYDPKTHQMKEDSNLPVN